jgi:tRNA (adenine22-N1)-methyltransferase
MNKRIARQQMPNLSKRLQKIVSMVPCVKNIIDVGTGHGLIPIALISLGCCDHVLATDKRENPLRITETNIRRYGLENKITLQLVDGLSGIHDFSADCVILSGMGGMEMISILSSSLITPPILLLQPQKSLTELREYLSVNGYEIRREAVLNDRGRFYVIIEAFYTEKKQRLTLLEQVVGPQILKDPSVLSKAYLRHVYKSVVAQQRKNQTLCAIAKEIERRIHQNET